ARLAQHVRLGEEPRNVVVWHAPEETHTVAPFELRAQRTVAYEGERAFSEPCERVRKPHDILALLERADAEEARRAIRRRFHREPLEIDAARHDFRLPSCSRQLGLELAA